MTIHTAIEKFQRKLLVTQRPATVHYYQFYFGLLKRHLGDAPLSSIDEDRILTLIIALKEHHPNMKNITINKALSALKTIAKYSGNLHIPITRLAETKMLIPLIQETTIQRILSGLNQNLDRPILLRNYLIVKILLETGLRMHELIHLQKKHLDFATNSITVMVTKTHHHRVVCYKDETIPHLQQWLLHRPDIPFLFYNLKTGGKMTTASIESLFYQLKKRYQIQDNITPHKWRHTFATQFLRRGGNLETLRMLLGHSNLKTTQKYLHLSEVDIRQHYRQIMEGSKKE